jgi:hypothetical protein
MTYIGVWSLESVGVLELGLGFLMSYYLEQKPIVGSMKIRRR